MQIQFGTTPAPTNPAPPLDDLMLNHLDCLRRRQFDNLPPARQPTTVKQTRTTRTLLQGMLLDAGWVRVALARLVVLGLALAAGQALLVGFGGFVGLGPSRGRTAGFVGG